MGVKQLIVTSVRPRLKATQARMFRKLAKPRSLTLRHQRLHARQVQVLEGHVGVGGAEGARQFEVVIAALVRQPLVLARQSRILKARSLLSLHEVAKNLT